MRSTPWQAWGTFSRGPMSGPTSVSLPLLCPVLSPLGLVPEVPIKGRENEEEDQIVQYLKIKLGSSREYLFCLLTLMVGVPGGLCDRILLAESNPDSLKVSLAM